MKKLLFTLFLIANSVQSFAQILNVSPAFPTSTDIVTITYKATDLEMFFEACQNIRNQYLTHSNTARWKVKYN